MGEVIIQNLSKSFKKHIIFEDVNITINKGDIFGILGPSGSGKSVLIKILMGYIKPSKGFVKINGRVGFSIQDNSYYENLTLYQNLNYFAKINNVKNRKEKIDSLIKILSLEEYKKIRIMNLSGGTKKRADLACALLKSPDILILDEPFTGLDSFLINQLIDFFKELQKQGITIILSSHRLQKMDDFCNRFVFINQGKVSNLTKDKLKKLYK